MAKVIITKENLLSLDEFRVLLEQMAERSSKLDDVLSLLRDLVAYENKYKMGSDIFYARFMRGEMGDDMPFIMWAGQYELYLEAKLELTNQLRDAPVAARWSTPTSNAYTIPLPLVGTSRSSK